MRTREEEKEGRKEESNGSKIFLDGRDTHPPSLSLLVSVHARDRQGQEERSHLRLAYNVWKTSSLDGPLSNKHCTALFSSPALSFFPESYLLFPLSASAAARKSRAFDGKPGNTIPSYPRCGTKVYETR